MKRLTSVILSMSIALSAAPAFAAVFQVAKDDDELFSVSIPIQDDLYVAGGLVHVNETVAGDLHIAGGEVTIIGDVKGDLIGVGGSVNVDGNVWDDVRIAAGEVKIQGTIGDDLIIAGGNVRIEHDAVIDGDAYVFGGMLIVDGTVKGNLKMAGGNMVLSGVVNGDVDVNGGNFQLNGEIGGNAIAVSDEANVGSDASIAGNLEYWVPYKTNPYEEVVKGETTLNKDLRAVKKEVMEKTALGAMKVALLAIFGFMLLSSALFILLMIAITKNYFKDAGKKVMKTPWMCMLKGLMYFVLMPIIAFLFLVTVIGFPISLLLFFSYGFALFFAKPLTALVIAGWAQQYYKKKWGKIAFFFVAVGFYILLKLLVMVPVIGWIIVLAIILIAFGALVETKFEKWKKIA